MDGGDGAAGFPPLDIRRRSLIISDPMSYLYRNLCLSLIGLLLLGYAIGGKGFAYLGIPPLFIGDVVLLISVFLFFSAPDIRILTSSKTTWAILVFDLWCAAQTIPHLEAYGLDALRDAVIYGYSIFALLIAAYMNDKDVIRRFVNMYAKLSFIIVILLPVLIVIQPAETDFAGGDAPLLSLKSGDLAVHLTGALAFRLLGLGGNATPRPGLTRRILDGLFWASWSMAAVWTMSISRGSMLAVFGGILVLNLFGIGRRFVLGGMALAVVALVTFSTFGVRIETERREVSAEQLVANALSVFMDERPVGSFEGVDFIDLEGTTYWRLSWWQDILDYTMLGDYFWTGKGFGVNLADNDGYQVDPEGRLRSPHNGHLTILARAGVPGLLLWTTVFVTFAAALIAAMARLRRVGAIGWQRLNLWVLVYWVAGTINATFDVYLEGPQGGIWYWSIIGFGIAIMSVEQRALAPRPMSPPAQPFAAEHFSRHSRSDTLNQRAP